MQMSAIFTVLRHICPSFDHRHHYLYVFIYENINRFIFDNLLLSFNLETGRKTDFFEF